MTHPDTKHMHELVEQQTGYRVSVDLISGIHEHAQMISARPANPVHMTGEVAGQVAGQVSDELRRILAILRKEMSRQAIQAALALRGCENFEARYLKPALEADLVERTIPAKPNSRLQKYRLTEKGRELVGKTVSQ
ncbi:MAG: hypothetical protein NTZ94_13995 [Verrucomicrobia bacterium]|nr:hypothetical protein [Verrucomicrobiota bacterium]